MDDIERYFTFPETVDLWFVPGTPRPWPTEPFGHVKRKRTYVLAERLEGTMAVVHALSDTALAEVVSDGPTAARNVALAEINRRGGR